MPSSRAAAPSSADVLARQMGFPDAATYFAWKQRQQENQGPAVTGNAMPQSLGQVAHQAFALHPAVLFQNILDAWNRVAP